MPAFFARWGLCGGRAAIVAALGGVLATATPSRADYNWTGAVSSDWFDPGNWSGGVPTNGFIDSTFIDTTSPHAVVVGTPGAQSNIIHVGSVGSGALTIQNGGVLTDYAGVVAAYPGSTGIAIVDGTGSAWINTGPVFIAMSGGDGTLIIRNGGTVTFDEASSIGYGGIGTAIVDGAGSNWTGPQLLGVVNGTLTISNGGTVSSSNGYISQVNGPGVGAVAIVDGIGSRWINSADFYIGWMGDGSLTVRNGGVVSAPSATIGFQGGRAR